MTVARIYRSVPFYRMLMWLLYHGKTRRRLDKIAEWVPSGASVLEVCAGPGDLAEYVMRRGAASYNGLELSPVFVRAARKRGIAMQLCDVRTVVISPQSYDCVIMAASLYQFYPNHKAIVDSMLDWARQRLIIVEPTRNLSSSSCIVISRAASRATAMQKNNCAFRFNEASFMAFIEEYGNCVVHIDHISSRRETRCILNPVVRCRTEGTV